MNSAKEIESHYYMSNETRVSDVDLPPAYFSVLLLWGRGQFEQLYKISKKIKKIPLPVVLKFVRK